MSNCCYCAKRDKCMLRARPELCETFCYSDAEDAESEEKQAEEHYREELNVIAEQYGD